MLKKPDKHFDLGMTLVELLIVVACGSSVIISATPAFHRIQQEWNLWTGAHLVESSLAWGRMHAVTSNNALMFQVDNDGKRVLWLDAATSEILWTSIRFLPGDSKIVSSPRSRLRFYPHGNAAPAGTFRVQNACGSYRVIVNIAGRIRVARE